LNLAVSNREAWADSHVESLNPPADKLVFTPGPKIAAAMKTKTATATTRRGAVIASSAIRLSTLQPYFLIGGMRIFLAISDLYFSAVFDLLKLTLSSPLLQATWADEAGYRCRI
jgi:hypothetical protein